METIWFKVELGIMSAGIFCPNDDGEFFDDENRAKKYFDAEYAARCAVEPDEGYILAIQLSREATTPIITKVCP